MRNPSDRFIVVALACIIGLEGCVVAGLFGVSVPTSVVSGIALFGVISAVAGAVVSEKFARAVQS